MSRDLCCRSYVRKCDSVTDGHDDPEVPAFISPTQGPTTSHTTVLNSEIKIQTITEWPAPVGISIQKNATKMNDLRVTLKREIYNRQVQNHGMQRKYSPSGRQES